MRLSAKHNIFDSTDAELVAGDTPWDRIHRRAVQKQVWVWDIFKTVFGEEFDTRFGRVISGQFEFAGVTAARLGALDDPTVNPSGMMPEAFGYAPLFGQSYNPDDYPDAAPTVDELLQDSRATFARIDMKLAELNQVLMGRDIKMWALESGQNILAGRGAPPEGTTGPGPIFSSNPDFVTNQRAAQVHDDMYGVYKTYLNNLEFAGFEVAMHLGFVYKPTNTGTWGALTALDARWEDSPKMRAIVDWSSRR